MDGLKGCHKFDHPNAIGRLVNSSRRYHGRISRNGYHRYNSRVRRCFTGYACPSSRGLETNTSTDSGMRQRSNGTKRKRPSTIVIMEFTDDQSIRTRCMRICRVPNGTALFNRKSQHLGTCTVWSPIWIGWFFYHPSLGSSAILGRPITLPVAHFKIHSLGTVLSVAKRRFQSTWV